MMAWLPSALLDHLWQSTLFVTAVWVATLALRENSARVRYWLWVAGSLKFLVPFSVLMSLGESIQWQAPPAAVEPVMQVIMVEVLQPAATLMPVPVAVAQSASILPLSLVALWAIGCGVVLMAWWRQSAPIRSALRLATPVLLDATHGAGDLTVWSSPLMPEPGVVGLTRPRLVLPMGLVERLTAPQLRALIAHERCHVRCHDNVVAAVHMIVEALFWFHPATWWIERRLVDERERACDQSVLRAGGRPSDYAECILEVCRQSVGLRLMCVAGVSGANLRARVEAIMRDETGRPMSRSRRLALVVAAMAALAAPIAGGALTAQSQIVVPPAGLEFESASIRQSSVHPGKGPFELAMEGRILQTTVAQFRGGRFATVSTPLQLLIEAAYQVTRFQIEEGPEWVRTEGYVIEALAAQGIAPDQMRGTLRAFLAERFKLTLRREKRLVPVYELVVADGDLKIEPMKPGECVNATDIRWDQIDWEAPRFICGRWGRRMLSQSPETRPLPRWPRVVRIEAGGISMQTLIDATTTDLDRLVVDKTGFTAPFNLLLDFASLGDPTSSGPSLFEALHDQLGLRLRPGTASVDVLVIESVERPAAN